jgi:putative oxidoreductase
LLKNGFWAAAHEARTDWSMILGLLFLLIVGSGSWSVDDLRSRNKEDQNSQ